MRCPFKQIKTTEKSYEGGEYTKEVTEFGVCDMRLCPYFAIDYNGGYCWKVAQEVGRCDDFGVR
mgnify:CR=1 FL=1|jgi:hypothetical protein